MTAKSRVKKLLKKRKNKEINDDNAHSRHVRRTEGSHTFEAQRDAVRRWNRGKGYDSPSSAATPGQPPRA